MSIRVSVVVPTLGRPQLLDRCLAALAAQDYDPAAYEVIVADDGPGEDTRRVVAHWAQRGQSRGLSLRYLPVTAGHGPAAARNAGWQAACGAIIAFTDDDCIPQPDWLRAGTAAFVDGVAGATGRIVVPLSPPTTDYEADAARLQSAEFATANCFYRRSALESVAGFDERFRAAWREDTDLFFRLLAANRRLVRVPEAVVVHPVRPAAWGVSLRQQRKSMFNALLYKKHRALYRERVQARPPWHYYAIVAAQGGALLGLLTGRRQLALASSGAWLILVGLFSFWRLRSTSRAPRHVAEMVVTSSLIPTLSVFWRLRGGLRFRVFFL